MEFLLRIFVLNPPLGGHMSEVKGEAKVTGFGREFRSCRKHELQEMAGMKAVCETIASRIANRSSPGHRVATEISDSHVGSNTAGDPTAQGGRRGGRMRSTGRPFKGLLNRRRNERGQGRITGPNRKCEAHRTQ